MREVADERDGLKENVEYLVEHNYHDEQTLFHIDGDCFPVIGEIIRSEYNEGAMSNTIHNYSPNIDHIASKANMISFSSSSQRISSRKRSNSSSTETQPVGKKQRTNDHL